MEKYNSKQFLKFNKEINHFKQNDVRINKLCDTKNTSYDSYKETTIINRDELMIGEVEPSVLFEQYDEEESSLSTHNQELVRSGRDRAARLLNIQNISHLTSAENEIFQNELNIDVERSAGVISHISQFSTEYNRAHHNIGQWYLSRLEEQNWQYLKQVFINERDDTRNITISLPLPPMVIKVPINYNWELRETLIDYSFRQYYTIY